MLSQVKEILGCAGMRRHCGSLEALKALTGYKLVVTVHFNMHGLLTNYWVKKFDVNQIDHFI